MEDYKQLKNIKMEIKPHISLIKTSNKHPNLFTISKVRDFNIESDEPLDHGGQNLAPTPFDLLNSALASCTVIYLRLFALRNNIDIGEISLKIKIKKNENDGFLFERTISFSNKISESDKNLISEAIKDTPVTKIIRLSQTVETKLI